MKTLSLTTLFLALLQVITQRWSLVVFYLIGFCGYRWLLGRINPTLSWRSFFVKAKPPDFLAAPPKEELQDEEQAQLLRWQWQLAFLFGFILGAPALLGIWYFGVAGFVVGFFSLFLLLRIYLHFSQRQARKIVAYYERMQGR